MREARRERSLEMVLVKRKVPALVLAHFESHQQAFDARVEHSVRQTCQVTPSGR